MIITHRVSHIGGGGAVPFHVRPCVDMRSCFCWSPVAVPRYESVIRKRFEDGFFRVAPSSCYSVINNINNNIDVKRYHLIDYCKSRSISKAIDSLPLREPLAPPPSIHRPSVPCMGFYYAQVVCTVSVGLPTDDDGWVGTGQIVPH